MHMIKKDQKMQNGIMTVMCLAFVIWTQRRCFSIKGGWGYFLLEALYTVCMTMVFAKTAQYLFDNDNGYFINKYQRYYLLLFVLQVVAFMPMFTQNFMYGDDLWGFATDYNGNLDTGLYFSRPFISFLMGILPKTTSLNIRYFRIINALFMYLFGCLFFRFIMDKTKSLKLAFLVSVGAIATCSAVDCIAYASVYPINISLMCSAISIILYFMAIENKGKKKTILLIESGICLFSAFCFYQIGTPIVFVFWVIYEKYSENKSEKSRLIRSMYYLGYYAVVAVSYLVVNSGLQTATGVANGQATRGQIIRTIAQIYEKIEWFFNTVCPQALGRVAESVCGNSLFIQNNLFYTNIFKNQLLGNVILCCMLLVIIVSIIATAYRKKSIVYILITMMAIPLSFYPFLILPESYFLTYYGMPIIILFLWYLMDGIKSFRCIMNTKLNTKLKTRYNLENVLFGGIIIVTILQSNYYAETAWVNYCRDSYEYIANSISAGLTEKENIDTIIVRGTISPYVGGRDYVIFCVEDVLREFQLSPDKYNISQIDNGYYLLTFPDSEVKMMEDTLGEKIFDELLEFYLHDDLYNRWVICNVPQKQEQLNFLKDCFEKTGQLIFENESAISIDMMGFNNRNSF